MTEEARNERMRSFFSRAEKEIEENNFRFLLRPELNVISSENSFKDALSFVENLRSPLTEQGRQHHRSIANSPKARQESNRWADKHSANISKTGEDEFALIYSKGVTLTGLFARENPDFLAAAKVGQNKNAYSPRDVLARQMENEEQEEEDEHADDQTKKGKARRLSKGLKLLSLVVRDIVVERQSTTYKEVAEAILRDAVALEGLKIQGSLEIAREEQNIKRRVYDALNVLISAGVLIKEGKRVRKNEVNKKIKVNMKRMEAEALRLKMVS